MSNISSQSLKEKAFGEITNAITWLNLFKNHPIGIRLKNQDNNTFTRESTSLFTSLRRWLDGESRMTNIDQVRHQFNFHKDKISSIIVHDTSHRDKWIQNNVWIQVYDALQNFMTGILTWSKLYENDPVFQASVNTLLNVTIQVLNEELTTFCHHSNIILFQDTTETRVHTPIKSISSPNKLGIHPRFHERDDDEQDQDTDVDD